jgi:malonyl CoA-acyl carrier protein transacylase
MKKQPVAIVGMGVIAPDAVNVNQFWDNIKNSKYSITEVPANRWDTSLYFDPNPQAIDKTYSKIGGWVKDFSFNPLKLGIPIPPKVLLIMDETQQWAIEASRQALADYGYPQRTLPTERVAVILGNAMAGENHYKTSLRIHLPEFTKALSSLPSFQNLPKEIQNSLLSGFQAEIWQTIPEITEDTMPGELSNIIAGRVANVFNFQGPNFTTDAACASSLAAIQTAIDGLCSYQYDAVLTGGVDRNMGVESYVKFSKIGALSPDGSRPYTVNANGFVMGEGGMIFLLKRLEDAERDGDLIYAVIRGIGSSSDGKGKGITAPNPSGQIQAILRAWESAGVSPASAGLIEGHGTSTRVGDVVEVESLAKVFSGYGLRAGQIAIGSVKSNIGHLKSAAGAAGLLKTAMALYEKVLPPTTNFDHPNPKINFQSIPFYVNTELKEWPRQPGEIRRAGISAFGFGGTNFHLVVDEYVPGMGVNEKPIFASVLPVSALSSTEQAPVPSAYSNPAASSEEVLQLVLNKVSNKTGYPLEMLDPELDLEADLGVDTVKQAELFAEIREQYNIPRKEDLVLADYNTIAKVVQFIQESLPDSGNSTEQLITPSSPDPEIESTKSVSGPSHEEVVSFLLSLVSEKTGYPVEMLDLDLDLEADLGVDTVKQAELFAAVRENYGIARREDLVLADYNTLEKVVQFVLGAQTVITPQQQPAQPMVQTAQPMQNKTASPAHLPSYRGLFFASAETPEQLKSTLTLLADQIKGGLDLEKTIPTQQGCALPERIAIDYENRDDLVKRVERALKAFDSPGDNAWKALSGQGIYRGSGAAGKMAFLFPGQGSQYANMLKDLIDHEPVIAETFREADEVMTPLLGKPLTDYIFCDGGEEELAKTEAALKDTTITQPAVLSVNIALLRLLEHYGFSPDMVIGHSLGEYGALVAAGVLTFREALEVVSARGREMSKVSMDDNGCMAAVSAPLAEVERILQQVEGYVVLANYNSPVQSVIGGSTPGIDNALVAFKDAGYQAVKIPVSHAFHTQIVAPASEPLRNVIARMNVQAPRLPIMANVTGEEYPHESEKILDLLAKQVSSPVRFIQGVENLYAKGARVFIESGPKRVLSSLTADILSEQASHLMIAATNHPRKGGPASFNETLCALFAAGIYPTDNQDTSVTLQAAQESTRKESSSFQSQPIHIGAVVISGAGLGLPGLKHPVFDDENIRRLLNGENSIEALPESSRKRMLEKRLTRLVKSEAGAIMQEIDSLDLTLKLAGQRGSFNLAEDFGVPAERVDTFDIATQLAIGAGIEALRDAGIPLMMHFKQTSKGTLLPNRWMLPPALADETGVIFASAFPGLDQLTGEMERYYDYQQLRAEIALLRQIKAEAGSNQIPSVDQKLAELSAKIEQQDYHFDRRFIFRILAMGHSQFAEYIGAKGPNTQVNAACASTTQALGVADDWIRAGRCRRVVIVAGDDVTGGSLVNWVGTGLLATGATTIEGDIRQAALPFDRRRNGMIPGMGAAALVVESQEAVQERGMTAICEIVASQFANSAFHGTRLDVEHVSMVMQRLIAQAEQRFGLRREEIASQTMFVSHETYTPARGGSASAEIRALRDTFGENANQVIIANTKGFTGHTMGVGVEDVIAVKALETGLVPPIAHLDEAFEADPDLGDLNLSRGGQYPVRYALRLGAGFGSQIAMTLLRQIVKVGEKRVDPAGYQQWLAAISGQPDAKLEVVQRTLRFTHNTPPLHTPAQPTWQPGSIPAFPAAQIEPVVTEIEAPPTQIQKTVQTTEQIQPVAKSEEKTSPMDTDKIRDVLLGMVSEKTGYPVELLNMDLDLEADLGIDTVKQAELFAAMREYYGIPRREDLSLADYNTLAKVVGFIEESLAAQQAQNVDQVEPVAEIMDVSDEQQAVEAVLKRRIPVPVLRPRIELCKPTTVKLNSEQRILIVKDQNGAHEALSKRLRTKKVAVQVVDALDLEKIQKLSENSEIDGIYFLPGLDLEASFDRISIEGWQAESQRRVMPLYTLMRALPDLKFLVCATRLGGLFGFSGSAHASPLGGLVSGFAKAIAKERPAMLVKVVDFETQTARGEVAVHLLNETLNDPSVVEIGIEQGQRFAIAAVEQPLMAQQKALSFDQNSVIVVSGGTAGVISPVLVDLAKRFGGKYYLLARSELPNQNSQELNLLAQDRGELRKHLMAKLKESHEKATPAMAEKEIARLERSAATWQTLRELQQLGAEAHYLVCDVTNPVSVDAAIQKIALEQGRIDVLIHAAGIEISRRIESKSNEEFLQTIAVKADGLLNLYQSFKNLGCLPQAIVGFSSVAGRFGNAGQTDYSAANDLLAKSLNAIQILHPEIRTLTLDWSAWAEVGMASRGSIPRIMKMAGIDMLAPQEAAPQVFKELNAGSNGEVILAGSLGVLTQGDDPQAALQIDLANQALTAGKPIHVMLSRVTGLSLTDGIILEADLDPQQQPFLYDHALNGTPVLPGVMGIEGFSVAARHIASILAAKEGSYQVARLEDIHFMAPFKFYRNEPRRVTWKANVFRNEDGLVGRVQLESRRTIRGQANDERVQHFSGKVYLSPTKEDLHASPHSAPHWQDQLVVSREDIYKLYFHGPAFQVLDGVARDGDHILGKMHIGLPQITAEKQEFLSLPQLVELCLQTAGVYEVGQTGVLALPSSIGSLTLYERPLESVELFAEVRPHKTVDGQYCFDASVVDANGNRYLEISEYRTAPLPYTADQQLVEPLKILAEEIA